MVRLPIHEERLTDRAIQNIKLGPLADRRGDHLNRLGPLEEMVRERSPLAISYDVQRCQPPYFQEFTYTEMLGGLIYVAPLSCEIAARVMAYAVNEPTDGRFDVVANLVHVDKYRSRPSTNSAPLVAFLPGSNIFIDAVSKDFLDREMHRHDVWLKLHPLTNDETVRQLGGSFGFNRFIDKDASGHDTLMACSVAYVPTSSEMGLKALLLGKEIRNLTRISFEARGVYNPFYRLLWDLPISEAADTLRHLLNSPFSGVFHPDDPNVAEKIDNFFHLAMELREPFKPLVREYDAPEYGALVSGRPFQPMQPRGGPPHA